MSAYPSEPSDATQNPPDVIIANLSDDDLVAHFERAMLAFAIAPRFTFRRRRWYRFHLAASQELGARLQRHNASGVCDICKQRRANHHQIRDGETGRLFEHHCGACVGLALSGWFTSVTAEQGT